MEGKREEKVDGEKKKQEKLGEPFRNRALGDIQIGWKQRRLRRGAEEEPLEIELFHMGLAEQYSDELEWGAKLLPFPLERNREEHSAGPPWRTLPHACATRRHSSAGGLQDREVESHVSHGPKRDVLFNEVTKKSLITSKIKMM